MSARAATRKRPPVRPRSMWTGMDYALLLSFIGLLLFGVVMVTSASIGIVDARLGDAFYYGRRQLIFVGMGLLLAFVALRTPTQWLDRLGFILLLLAFALLVAVLLPVVGKTVNGARRWINFGFITLQVSEFARLCLLIYLAGYMVRRGEEVRSSLRGFIKPLLVIAIAAALLLAEPDFGAAAVLTATCLGMLFLAGARVWQFAACLLIAASLGGLLVWLEPYRMQRMMAFVDPWHEDFMYGSGYQLTQSLIAIGSGGIFGLGLGASVQKLFYLPEPHNDFVFAIVGEELGLLGVTAVLLVFAVLIQRILAVAARALQLGQAFSAYLCYGIALWLSAQVFINTGVSMGLLPTKGLTLPLMSAGGSAVMATCLALGMVLRVNLENAQLARQALPARSKAKAAPGSRADADTDAATANTASSPADAVADTLPMPAPDEQAYMADDTFLHELDREIQSGS